MLIIDGDLYVYKAGFAHKGKEVGFKIINNKDNSELDFGNISLTKAKNKCMEEGYTKEEWRLVYYNNPFPLNFVLSFLDEVIESLLNKFNAPKYKMFITSSDYSNYRFKIATITPYKGSRRKCSKCFERCKAVFNSEKNIILFCKNCGEVNDDTTFADKPHYYNEIRDHLIKKWNAELVYNEEADDAMSILARQRFLRENQESIMVHIDKDINNTPGKHYNPDKDLLYNITDEDSLNNFYTQFLLGDNVDCIPGVHGIGPVAAKEFFKECYFPEEYEKIIMEIYQGELSVKRFINKMCLTPDQAYDRLVEIGQLLHIRQKENELWQPTVKRP